MALDIGERVRTRGCPTVHAAEVSRLEQLAGNNAADAGQQVQQGRAVVVVDDMDLSRKDSGGMPRRRRPAHRIACLFNFVRNQMMLVTSVHIISHWEFIFYVKTSVAQ